MQLVAFWVYGHYLFNTTSFNLGGKHLYEFDLKGNTLTVRREENQRFVPNFFSDSSPNLSLVSAIVGQNGVGKSTALTVIRNAILPNNTWGGYVLFDQAVLIFEDEFDNRVYMIGSNPVYPEYEATKISIEFAGFSITEKLNRVETIYYSPFFEARDFFFNHSDAPDIDISADSLLHYDIRENDSKEKFSPLLEHRYQNIYRQFSFLTTPLARVLYENFGIPFFDNVELSFRGPSFIPDNKNFHNTPYAFRPFLTKLLKLWRDEIDATKREVNSRTKIEEDRKIVKLWFLRELLSSFCAPLEARNTYLDEGGIEITLNELDNLSLEEALVKFLENHNFTKFKRISLPTKAIKKFIGTSFSIIEALPKENFLDTDKIKLGFDDARKILDAHKDFLYGMRIFDDNPIGFIDLSPSNHIDLSSGEKAVLDLLSRFHFSIQKIQKRKEGEKFKSYGATLPGHFILLLDEGDMGFHPVWKKKYVKTIVDVLPKFFEQYEGATVQIIFTTHDPLTLSDMPNCNVVYMKREGDNCIALEIGNASRPRQSFGANISTLLSDSFFVEDGLVGDFAVQKIDKTIQWLQDKNDSSDLNYHQRVIENIDEPLIRKKLSEMFAEKTGQSLLELKAIEAQIRMLEERKKELQKKS